MRDEENFDELAVGNYLNKLIEDFSLSPEMVHEVSLDSLDYSSYNRAAIIFHAVWSGQSVATLKLLCSELKGAPTQFSLLIVNADEIADIDANLDLAKTLFGQVFGAMGEVCWIRDGLIVARDVYGRSKPAKSWNEDTKDLIRKRIIELCTD